MITEQEMLEVFPYPSYRKYQKETILKIGEKLNSGYKVILLDSPTGAGKSGINTVFCRLFRSFYVTPQLTLIDQILADKNIGEYYTEIKGRENYNCSKDIFYFSTVREGMCRREPQFKCNKYTECPYYSQKMRAIHSPSALMSFAYFILEGQIPEDEKIPRFGNRDLVVLDESHSVDRFVIDHVNVEVSPFRLPKEFYDSVKSLLRDGMQLSDVVEYVKFVKRESLDLSAEQEQLTLTGETVSISQVKNKDRYDDFIKKSERFISTYKNSEWVYQIDWITYRGEPCKRLLVQPVYAKDIMPELVWKRGDKFIISSATILSSEIFIRETGLNKKFKLSEIYHLKVPSTFPPENRPILDLSQGKMRKDKIEENLPVAVRRLEDIIEHEKGKNIAVHCHSYKVSKAIEKLIHPKYKELLIIHTSDNREEELERWKESKGKVFLAVAFTEGQDWRDEICGALVVAKLPFPDQSDRRIKRRLERGAYNWYYLETLKTLIQGCGRAVRSPEESKVIYILDGSFKWLIRRTRQWIPQWFWEAIEPSVRGER